MRDTVKVTGMVIRSSPVGEYDKRLVLLCRERGKITAFAHGARKPGNQLMGPARTFAFGVFTLYEGRDAYTLQSAEIRNYFEGIAADMEAACYGSYFLELSDYFAQENMDSTELLVLVYQSLRALLKPAIPNRLARRVFELKSMAINGEYTEHPPGSPSQSCNYAWEYVIASPPESLYRFTLTEPVLLEFEHCVETMRRRYIERRFHSLEVLDMLLT